VKPIRILLPILFMLRAADAEVIEPESGSAADRPKTIRYEPDRGLVFETNDGSTSLWLGLRLQIRYTNLPGDAVDPLELTSQHDDELTLNRARIKLGGHLFHPSIDIYSEYDFKEDRLLDFRATIRLRDSLKFRVGQWKTEFNRERVDSSGKQQFADRSIANYWFTLDRQLGVELQGRVGEGRPYDFNYWLAFVSGQGREGGWRSGDGIGVARIQWNVFGREASFSQSDIGRRSEPVLTIGFAGLYGESPYTRFSSGGASQLPLFLPEGEESTERTAVLPKPNVNTNYPILAGWKKLYDRSREEDTDFELVQFMQDSIYHGHGFSWQQELHWKEVGDKITGEVRHLWGGYAQMGYFLHESWERIPEPLELAVRYAIVDPNTSHRSDIQQEFALAANWFFEGHRNKLTADVSYLSLDDPGDAAYEWRHRVQWDVSF
jgi:hypothetical protein